MQTRRSYKSIVQEKAGSAWMREGFTRFQFTSTHKSSLFVCHETSERV